METAMSQICAKWEEMTPLVTNTICSVPPQICYALLIHVMKIQSECNVAHGEFSGCKKVANYCLE